MYDTPVWYNDNRQNGRIMQTARSRTPPGPKRERLIGEPWMLIAIGSLALRNAQHCPSGRRGVSGRRFKFSEQYHRCRLPMPLWRQCDSRTRPRMGGPVDNHPVIEPRYRAAPRLGKCRGDYSMEETRDCADEQSRPEGHRLPLMPEIRFAH
jgi:hypothetical protein